MTKEYIEKEAAIKAIEQYGLQDGSMLGYHSGAIECAIEAIEMLPAEKVERVIHCRECSHYVYGVCDYHAAAVLPEWFCWNGEEKK